MKDITLKLKEITQPVNRVLMLSLTSDSPLPSILPGQFLHLEVPDKDLLLRRPFCIYDHDEYSIKIYAAIVGQGTSSLSTLKAGTELKAILPLGNGFDISKYNNIALFGGGMGCAELFSSAKAGHGSGKNFYAYLGFKSKDRILFESDFKEVTKKLCVCTYDGSNGNFGDAGQELKNDLKNFDAVFVCGSNRLLNTAKEILKDTDLPVFVSIEQRMACGVGACLVCTCAVKDGAEIKNKRVCIDGPVFNLKDLV